MSQESIVILQARTNSSRLPGKVMLPINGIPLVVLAAKRAGNKGRQVIVATSSEPTDDGLVNLLRLHEISYFRGELNNTLKRFVNALEGQNENTLIFRLTADNTFPDGDLLDDMEEDFLNRNLDYICCGGENSGLPYGVSVELTRVAHLREALSKTKDIYDLEHVTPYVRRKFGESYLEKYKSLGKNNYRCTVDCLDDYIALEKVFSGLVDPVHTPVIELINRLDLTKFCPFHNQVARKLVLGTAQLGMTYGISNQLGQPSQLCAETLIKTAISNGVSYIDTARAYGNSEEVIGAALKDGWRGRTQVITKLSTLQDCPPTATSAVVNAFVDASIYRSCSALELQKLDAVLLHRTSHLRDWGGAAWRRLIEHKAKGVIKVLGVSVQSTAELELALTSAQVELIQMPFNVLDWRWEELIPRIRAVKSERKLTIHIRSGLLQGLLVSNNKEHWYKANVVRSESVIAWLANQTQKTQSLSAADFCLRYIKSLDWVDGVVVGMESYLQLTDNIATFCRRDFTTQEINAIRGDRPQLNENSLNPACWIN